MTIIIILAIIIYLACIGKEVFIYPLVFLAIIACAILFKRCKEPEDVIVEEEHHQTLQNLIDSYGQPADIIVTDVTRGNETDGAVLVYDKGGRQGKGFLVCNGTQIDKDDITDVTFHNKFGTAFGLPDEFQVVLSTNDENQPLIGIRAGNDINTAKEIIAQIKSHLEI